MIETYLRLRTQLLAAGYGQEYEWAQTVRSPDTTPERFVAQAIWVICCSGFKEQAARVTEAAVWKALEAGNSATVVFPRSGKGRAIDKLWSEREAFYGQFVGLLVDKAPTEKIVAWVATLPYVGGRILRYHFAKNLGVDCAKPDRHLLRLVHAQGGMVEGDGFEAVMTVCRSIANATGDRIATVDLLLWRACNLGILSPATWAHVASPRG